MSSFSEVRGSLWPEQQQKQLKFLQSIGCTLSLSTPIKDHEWLKQLHQASDIEINTILIHIPDSDLWVGMNNFVINGNPISIIRESKLFFYNGNDQLNTFGEFFSLLPELLRKEFAFNLELFI